MLSLCAGVESLHYFLFEAFALTAHHSDTSSDDCLGFHCSTSTWYTENDNTQCDVRTLPKPLTKNFCIEIRENNTVIGNNEYSYNYTGK